MSELKRYSCTVLVDASTGFNVEAISPEDAAEKAENLAAESGATSICHQCSANLEIGDFCGVMVYDEDLGEQVLDTTYGAEQIALLTHKLDALAAQRDEGLAREAQKNLVIDGLSLENQELQQRLAEAEKLLRKSQRLITGEFEGGCLSGMASVGKRLAYYDECRPVREAIQEFLASPGCADGEKS